MAIRIEKTEVGRDIVISGFEQGVASSPHKGFGNMQNVNIDTENGEVMCSFPRVLSSTPVITNGSISVTNSSSTVIFSPASIKNGAWITVTSGSGNIPGGTYFLQQTSGPSYNISSTFYGTGITANFSGTITFNTINMGVPVQSQTEKYYDYSGSVWYRYYVLDQTGYLWVYDTGSANIYQNIWVLPNTSISWTSGSTPTGLGLLNGWLFAFTGNSIYCKATCTLDKDWSTSTHGADMSPITSTYSHFAYTGHQGKMYYCDGNFVGSFFPNSSLLTGSANIQSYGQYTASGGTCTLGTLIGGSLPTVLNGTRIPVVFFAANGGSIPSSLTASKLYYISYNANGTFTVWTALSGGSQISDMATGASGFQYYNTFYPIGSVSAGNGSDAYTFTPQRLNLPFFESVQAMIEIGDIMIIGGKTNTLYPWNQVDPTPGDLIQLPENDVHYMIGVNNMGYIFAGHKGNIYITNGSTASKVLTVPDYTAGISGSPSSYIEPYFSWGGADYIRGRVYFSILDQTPSKAGNCGGIWSFVPTQNFFSGQDTGLALRMENTSSYGTLNGYANLIINSQVQTAVAPQFFSVWTSSISGPTYGIDQTGTYPKATASIESDLIPTGTMLNKRTFSQIEYKVSSPLLSGESVALSYRLNSTDAWTSCGTLNTETTQGLSGYYPANFQLGQWLQMKASLIPSGTATFSGNRLTEIRIRQ